MLPIEMSESEEETRSFLFDLAIFSSFNVDELTLLAKLVNVRLNSDLFCAGWAKTLDDSETQTNKVNFDRFGWFIMNNTFLLNFNSRINLANHRY